MAEDAKIDDGIRTRIKKGLKQLSKAREEARAAKEPQEEMQKKEEKAKERVLEVEENLWVTFNEDMNSREQNRRRPHLLSTKI